MKLNEQGKKIVRKANERKDETIFIINSRHDLELRRCSFLHFSVRNSNDSNLPFSETFRSCNLSPTKERKRKKRRKMRWKISVKSTNFLFCRVPFFFSSKIVCEERKCNWNHCARTHAQNEWTRKETIEMRFVRVRFFDQAAWKTLGGAN